MYDQNKDGVIETITAGNMLMDLYRAMNKDFHPTATDISSYARVFDRTNKGKITYDDLEAASLKYFWNEKVPAIANRRTEPPLDTEEPQPPKVFECRNQTSEKSLARRFRAKSFMKSTKLDSR